MTDTWNTNYTGTAEQRQCCSASSTYIFRIQPNCQNPICYEPKPTEAQNSGYSFSNKENIRVVHLGYVCMCVFVALRFGCLIVGIGIASKIGEFVIVDESSLTGEALPVTKRKGDDVLGGGVVQSGELELEVSCTGANTFFGKTLALLGGIQEQGHLKKVLQLVAKVMAALGAIICVILFFVVTFRDNQPWLLSLKFAFVLLTAVVPIAMPVVTTTVLSVGALELSKESAVVSRLSAIEEMAGIEILCSDKTGTLTLNKLSLDHEEILCEEGYSKKEVLKYAALASKLENAEPIDQAIGAAVDKKDLEGHTVQRFVPFNPVDKRAQSTVRFPDGRVRLVTKGAPHIIRDMVTEYDMDLRERIEETINKQAERGLRTLGVAISEGAPGSPGQSTWCFIGLVSLFDPPREDTAETIKLAIANGLDVKMITGDQRAIAIETARRLGMATRIVGPDVWSNDSHVMEQAGGLGPFVLSVNGFAGVYPEHKFKIVEALQKQGTLVGMTGDGVNDAPALKKANVGIAVAGATEAAKGAADIILLKPGLSTIVNALRISRTIFCRLQNYIMYRMASSTLICLFYFLSLLVTGTNMPTWTLILLSIINDFTIMSTAKDNVVPSQNPEKWDMRKVIVVAVAIGVTCVGECFLFLMLAMPSSRTALNFWGGFGLDVLSTEEFNAALYFLLAVCIQLNIFATRTRLLFWQFDKNVSRPPALFVMGPVFGSMLLSAVIATTWQSHWDDWLGGSAGLSAISWGHASVIVLYAVAWFVVADVVKVLVYRLFFSSTSADEDLLFNPLMHTTPKQTKLKQLLAKQNEAMGQLLAKDGLARLMQREEGLRERSKSGIVTQKSGISHLSLPGMETTCVSQLYAPGGLTAADKQHKMQKLEMQVEHLQGILQAVLQWKTNVEREGLIPHISAKPPANPVTQEHKHAE
eukprot:GHVT01062304.1.p1 GENE.GHVT01062304.1~~GHVT01062304.1.p1  ORF type:complete len:927 (+),score=112.78 GHVT01062304.1:1131-3911(+)